MNLVQELHQEITKINVMQRNALEEIIPKLSPQDRLLLESYILCCLDAGVSLEYLAASFDLITKDTLSNQIYFMKHGRYKFSSYAEVGDFVYHNPEYMSKYMYGLALTNFLWPNHKLMLDFFRENLPKERQGAYLEIGPGHGFFMMEAMRLSRFESFLGVDISATSVALTKSILGSGRFGAFSGYDIVEADFLTWEKSSSFDFIAMGEVLEHVEEPYTLLTKIRECARKDASIYVTTAINSPAVDHIYLFESDEHVESIVSSCGLTVKKKLLLPYAGKTVEESRMLKLPMNISLMLEVT